MMCVFSTHSLLCLAFFHTTINMYIGNITLKERQAGWAGIGDTAGTHFTMVRRAILHAKAEGSRGQSFMQAKLVK